MAEVKKANTAAKINATQKKEKRQTATSKASGSSTKSTSRVVTSRQLLANAGSGSAGSVGSSVGSGSALLNELALINSRAVKTSAKGYLFETDPSDRYRTDAESGSRDNSLFLTRAMDGLKAYEYNKAKQEKKEQEKTGFGRWGENLAYQAPSDANEAIAAFYEARKAYGQNSDYKSITEDWNDADRLNFGYLYSQNPKDAQKYAILINDIINEEKNNTSGRNIKNLVAGNMKKGMLYTVGALGSDVLFGMPELMDRVAEFAARGSITRKNYLTPKAFSQAVVSAIGDQLNGVDENGVAHSVLDERIPIVGGKGLGDVYRYGYGAARVLAVRNFYGAGSSEFGKAMIDADIFSDAAVRGINSRLGLGASGKQLMAMGSLLGAISVAAQQLELDRFLEIEPATTVGDFVNNMITHGVVNGLSETTVDGLGQLADYLVMGDKSIFNRRMNHYIREYGVTEAEAFRLAWQDTLQDLGDTLIGGWIEGSLSAAGQSLKQTLTDIFDGKAGKPENLSGERAPENRAGLLFSPELYRMGLEVTNPDGYSDSIESLHSASYYNKIETDSQNIDEADRNNIHQQNYDSIVRITTEAIPGTADNPIDIYLKYNPKWSDDQRAQADAKIKALSEAITVKSEVPEKRKFLKDIFLKMNNLDSIPLGFEIDHIIDLQLGGLDDIMNTQLLDISVNRSLGAQIRHAISQYDLGTVLGNFYIE